MFQMIGSSNAVELEPYERASKLRGNLDERQLETANKLTIVLYTLKFKSK